MYNLAKDFLNGRLMLLFKESFFDYHEFMFIMLWNELNNLFCQCIKGKVKGKPLQSVWKVKFFLRSIVHRFPSLIWNNKYVFLFLLFQNCWSSQNYNRNNFFNALVIDSVSASCSVGRKMGVALTLLRLFLVICTLKSTAENPVSIATYFNKMYIVNNND